MATTSPRASFARSTYIKSQTFNKGVSELASIMPLEAARAYLLYGHKDPAVDDALYNRVDKLQTLRKEAISHEMQHSAAQAFLFCKRNPDQALAYLENSLERRSSDQPLSQQIAQAVALDDAQGSSDLGACVRLLFGEQVLGGDDIRIGFGADAYAIAPSLQVYELFIWIDPSEFEKEPTDA